MRSKATLSSSTIGAAVFGSILFGTAPTSLAQECSTGSAEVLRLTRWTAEEEAGGTRVTMTFENTGSDALRMIQSTAWFSDALGNDIGGIELNPDVAIEPGATAEERSLILGFERLTIASPDDIEAIICTDAVVRSDGSQERFE